MQIKKRGKILIFAVLFILFTQFVESQSSPTGFVLFPMTGGCSDFNSDGLVDSADLGILRSSYLKEYPDVNYKDYMDYDDDLDIDYIDLTCWREDFGKSIQCPLQSRNCGCLQGCADFDSDGQVTNLDLNLLIQKSGSCINDPIYIDEGDFNRDNCINISSTSMDFLCFQENFGDTVSCNIPPQNNNFRITLSGNPLSIEANGNSTSELIATLYNLDNEIQIGKKITFSIISGLGSFTSLPTITTNSQGQAKITFKSASSQTDMVTEVKAQLLGNTQIYATISLLLIGQQTSNRSSITLTAVPSTIPADGNSISIINVTYTSRDNDIANKEIRFSITSGSGTLSQNSNFTNDKGRTSVRFRSIQSQTDISSVIHAQSAIDATVYKDITVTMTGQSSSGGGGPSGGSGRRRCRPDWECTQWTRCSISNNQFRVCNDLENCRTSRDKPSVEQICAYIPSRAATCESEWSCTEWNDCDNGLQTRNCVDLNSCSDQTTETRECYGNCNDGIKNNDEVDVDCGNSCKPCGRYGTGDIAKDLAIPVLVVLGILFIISYVMRKKSETI